MWIIWPFNKKNFGLAWTVCNDFRRFIEDDMGRYLIQDETRLPYAKKIIFESICVLVMTETNKSVLDNIRQCAFELAFFQSNVGPLPLHPLGVDTDAIGESLSATSRFKTPNPAGKAEYDRFKAARDLDWERMQATMKKLKPPA